MSSSSPNGKSLEELLRTENPTLSPEEARHQAQQLQASVHKAFPRLMFLRLARIPLDMSQPTWRQISRARLQTAGLMVLVVLAFTICVAVVATIL